MENEYIGDLSQASASLRAGLIYTLNHMYFIENFVFLAAASALMASAMPNVDKDAVRYMCHFLDNPSSRSPQDGGLLARQVNPNCATISNCYENGRPTWFAILAMR